MPNIMLPPGISTPSDDPLSSGPPVPSLRSAKPGGGNSGTGSSMSGAAHLLGGGMFRPMEIMMGIQNALKELMQFRPDIAQLFSPAIDRARTMLGAGMADIAQGGMGTPPADAALPPPALGMGGAQGMPPGGMPGGMPVGAPPGMPPPGLPPPPPV